MPRYKMVVSSDPVEGREEECNEWYQNVHLPELVALDGIKSARRFRRAISLGSGKTYSSMAIYEIETDDIHRFVKNLVTTAEQGGLTMSDALDRENSHAAIYEDFGFEVTET